MKEARTLVEKCKFIAGLEEGEEFAVVGSKYNPYKLINSEIINNYGTLVKVFYPNTIFKKLPWKPKEGDFVYIVSPFYLCGCSEQMYKATTEEEMGYKRNMIFKTEEEALARVKELGW